MTRNLNFGLVWINTYNQDPCYAPFGGLNQSGFGRDNGEEGLNEFLAIKTVYYGIKWEIINSYWLSNA